ncbi:MAG: TM0996/MTH895 family glutaredoxin-like protein [Candidatus Omnitrophica bacterium]|nr:TM0996/MTH895 family glutaredoxin-like protein [Candidatus Omnitrophota bacterium]MCA9415811.1 TM0996/MTH895 family glutaredoxin-like protein [Candidatus Omnitrophota bacterium]MCA9433321.1 TM0996/MTH895 family glutaredoxin-like protein [Candidatus Omnitrophota bacterium]MCA9438052.1 TM0996/MTH895 family glutaredoxin-like protein [Candidatus Omnitrophota bacterium]MCA9443787.1 TM0996/MTH895 family glutaredoxin-like protein [Candidatus Omnitrophota bacterium]
MKIEILGTGCAKCHALEANTRTAADELGCEYDLEKVTSIDEITSRGVMMTPALVVEGEVKLQGRLATSDQIRSILESAVVS